jgi:hypothetical protein
VVTLKCIVDVARESDMVRPRTIRPASLRGGAYLGYLAAHNVLGGSESEIASFFLRTKLIELAEKRFHDLDFPAMTPEE